MPTKINAYQCVFCGPTKVLKTKIGMRGHESACWRNPEQRACQTCKHQEFEEGEVPDLDEPDYNAIPRGHYCGLGLREVGEKPKIRCGKWEATE